MISYLSGQVKYIHPPTKKDNFFILDVNSVGYHIWTIPDVVQNLTLGEPTEIFTHHHIAETSSDLYGFFSYAEVELYKLLISISGIGPKKALTVLEQASMTDIEQAVVNEEPEILIKGAGLSKAVAEKIVLELQGKISAIPHSKSTKGAGTDLEALEALITLGYTPHQARQALAQVATDTNASQDKVKAALKILGQQ
ncbi:MAG: Holliday junction branch migration protein RuvA [Candidatus Buchananbacteria bacterium CG10_big_fil_rev_8_21_14_0_10_42_9]|uniref:Holliday junction branch migration complex subunit RuvA n=1 Tax=Candidatus Buchananbacteria bacterium CG10_big_fil_rev_8_21_14_0_10_42_9 TaxID=1974526 RepID=A0A2H0W284_9BACT|nr:MAG: Holliday junction branch migration protein RuvA [Candidatus Buchananbacteria bacterium CG10_big_fil_rev_8_21_14_0_10_42_9]